MTIIAQGSLVLIIFMVVARFIFSKYRDQKAVERSVPEDISKKIALLERRIVELKGENNMLKVGKSPDQKLSILAQQRAFLHDLGGKIQVLQGTTEIAMSLAKTIDHEKRDALITRLTTISRNLEQLAELHHGNRDFIIMAA